MSGPSTGLETLNSLSFTALLVLSAACVGLFVLRALLPREERKRVRFPLALLLVHLLLLGARSLLHPPEIVSESLSLVALFVLLVAVTRTGFLFLFDSSVGRYIAPSLPKIFRDMLEGLFYLGSVLLTLRLAGVEPGSLVTTSAFVTVILGLSMQDMIGNLFAGLSIEAQHPFGVGDWIQFDADPKLVGQVTEINWRATKVLTNEQVEVTVPNAILAKAPIRNYSRPTALSRRRIEFTCSSEASPKHVEALLLAAIEGTPEVATFPRPAVVPSSFDANGISYAVEYSTTNFAARGATDGAVRVRIWYALRRARVHLPHLTPQRAGTPSANGNGKSTSALLSARERFLLGVDVLAVLPREVLRTLAAQVVSRLYADNELIVRQGDVDSELFLIVRGEVRVLLGRTGGSTAEVRRLGPGQIFGELAFMTGEPRTATVGSVTECEVLVVTREAFQEALKSCPEAAERISRILSERQEELDRHLAERAARARVSPEERSGQILAKIRHFFSL